MPMMRHGENRSPSNECFILRELALPMLCERIAETHSTIRSRNNSHEETPESHSPLRHRHRLVHRITFRHRRDAPRGKKSHHPRRQGAVDSTPCCNWISRSLHHPARPERRKRGTGLPALVPDVLGSLFRQEQGSFLQDITLTTGVWSSFHSHESGADPGNWNEFDPIGGLAFSFKGGLKLETNYTSFVSMVDSYPTSSHLEVKLRMTTRTVWANARCTLGGLLAGIVDKATVVFDPATHPRASISRSGSIPRSIESGEI